MPDRRFIVRKFSRSQRQRITVWLQSGDCVIVEGGHDARGRPRLIADVPADALVAAEPIAVDRGGAGGE